MIPVPKIPPPVLLLIFLAIAIPFGIFLPIPIPMPGWLRWLGGAFTLAALALAFWAVREMRRAQTTLEPFETPSALVTGGPFRFSRNPIYVAYVCAEIGIPLALGYYWGAFLAFFLVDLYNRLVIDPEEKLLEEKFGSLYREYQSRVRRWL